MLGVCDESLGNVRGKSLLESGARQAKKGRDLGDFGLSVDWH